MKAGKEGKWMKAPITFAICGFGDRGSTYASMEKLFPEKMKVVAVADLNPDKVNKAKELYQIPEENCYLCLLYTSDAADE